ncbi:MAG TPA: hypothetical protein ENO14_02280, partial [Chromatiales bacterium]|nr:hypothetical protein [Chromatiales bacterium]
MRVVLSSNDLVCEPLLLGNALILNDGAQQISVIITGATPLTLSHERVSLRSGPMLRGPWVVGYATGMSQEDLVTALEADANISEAGPVGVPSELVGEITASAFPSLSRQDFYEGGFSTYHIRLPNQDAHPEDPSYWGDDPADHGWRHDFDMDLPQAWGITRGDSNVVIAVCDVGVNVEHLELSGKILRTDPPGDTTTAPGDTMGCPGECGVDDDNDGLIDEDRFGRSAGDLPEVVTNGGVPENVLTSYRGGNANVVNVSSVVEWSENVLAGWTLRFMREYGYAVPIIGNQATVNGITTIITSPDTNVNWILRDAGGFQNVADAGWPFYVSNGVDDDGDGAIDDFGYNTLFNADDDENGYIDDNEGWDFRASQRDVFGQFHDNDPGQPGSSHGTAIAGIIGGTWDGGSLVGIAPGVKILPVKMSYDLSCTSGSISPTPTAFEYCAGKGADIVSLSYKPGSVRNSYIITDSLGLLLTQAVGNAANYYAHPMGENPRTTLVAGTEPGGWMWYNQNRDFGSNYHETVDIAAPATHWVIRADECKPVDYDAWEGTSLASPVVAAVMGLMKSAYPHWDNDYLRAKLLVSTQDIEPTPPEHANGPQDADYVGRVGSGQVNAYRALTFYDDLFSHPDSSAVVTWSETVWISGDLHIPSWQTLE